MEFSKACNILYGGKSVDAKPEDNTSSKSERDTTLLHAKLTRSLMSKFEFVSTITTLAKYLFTIHDIHKYIADEEVNSILNPCELAYRLLNEGKFDAILDRGVERVHFSTLSRNPQWDTIVEAYFKRHNNAIQSEIVEGLMGALK
jgi:hypothetical protein